MPTVEALLEQYAEVRSQADLLRLDKEARRAQVLAAVQGELDAIDAEYDQPLSAAALTLAALENEIKQGVIGRGQSVKGDYFSAVYVKPRVTWDTKALDGYAAAHPEITAFRRLGEPSVTLRSK